MWWIVGIFITYNHENWSNKNFVRKFKNICTTQPESTGRITMWISKKMYKVCPKPGIKSAGVKENKWKLIVWKGIDWKKLNYFVNRN